MIVITQNDVDPSVETISKYDSNCGKSASVYYAEHLPFYIERAISNILQRTLKDKPEAYAGFGQAIYMLRLKRNMM